jgi:acyl-coenzyme A synthetase/AMP-(fatty) acid ligase/acyl carrier protein
MQSHRNVLHNVMLRTNLFRICADDRIGLPRSVTSGAVANYFLAFLNGASLFPFDPAKEGTALMPAWLAREKITFLSMSVPLFRHLPDNLSKENLSLRMVQFASQAVHRRDVQKFKACFAKQCLLINYFSSTETGPLAAFAIDPEVETSSDDVPIGFPLRDKEIFLFNSDGTPSGPGEIGEIVVRSRYLSPGYWREPELTAAKFINDPQDDGQRLYHTGDLAVRLLDGCLVYKGRKDFRVKIRGYGVEIVEVENALRRHPKIQETVVVTLKNDAQEDCLIAYIVTSDRARLSVGELRAFLNTKLPDYMVPVKFIPLERMPLTPNGKIDRQALPDPNQRRPDLHAPYVAPRTPLERELADIWSAVLAFDAVGVHDNFFDLGGHSLAAARAVTRVIETFQLELQVQALFDAPTVAQMAAVIEARQDSKMSNDTLNRMLTEIEAMPDEEAARLLADSGPPDERKRK